jgi:hypothetical protein
MKVENIQYEQRMDLHPRTKFVGFPNFPFGFTNWTFFMRCQKQGIVAKSIQSDHVLETTPHLAADRLDSRKTQHFPVEEPPNQPKKPPVEEPGNLPERPPMPSEPPVEEPPNEPDKPPVKEPPPKDPDREPLHKPPVRAMPDVLIAIGIKFIVDGLQEVFPGWAPRPRRITRFAHQGYKYQR